CPAPGGGTTAPPAEGPQTRRPTTMNDTLEDLGTIEDRIQRGDPETPRLRRQLAEGLLPLIRCAIRSGPGRPQLGTLVRAHLPATPSGGFPESAAPSLAHLLCDALLRTHPSRPDASRAACETVPGW